MMPTAMDAATMGQEGGLIVLMAVLTVVSFVAGRADRPRRRRAVRAVERAAARVIVADELRPGHEAAIRVAERRGREAAREACGCAESDRLLTEAHTEIADLRGQLDVLSKRHRRAQDLADRGGLVMARDLARVLNGQPLAERTPRAGRTGSTPEVA